MAPCIDTPDAPNCADFAEEVKDVLAYQSFVTGVWAEPPASAVLVAFHNLVTASIVGSPRTKKYLAPQRRRLYCLSDVWTSLPAQFTSDVAVPAKPPAVAGVPGLATQHQLLQCPA